MANEEQLKRLRQGVREWNVWRGNNPERIDLSRANLRGADFPGAISSAGLTRADFIEAISRANLSEADLMGVDLRGADLSEADLRGADLRGADLSEADLSAANLSSVSLSAVPFRDAHLYRSGFHAADLMGANLSEANLSSVRLSEADLSRANLRGAYLSSTVFAMNDLTSVKGLDTIRHHDPSRIDFRTVIFPRPGPILTTFLRGTGSSEYLIEALDGEDPSVPACIGQGVYQFCAFGSGALSGSQKPSQWTRPFRKDCAQSGGGPGS